MKPLHLTKTRLADRLTPSQRMDLSMTMFRNVVRAAVDSKANSVWVVGGDEAIEKVSFELGAEWFIDEWQNLNDSLNSIFAKAFDTGSAAIYLPADLPFVTTQDINAIVNESGDGQTLTLSPAHRDGGTNAGLVPCGSPFRLQLGIDSFKRHMQQAQSLGLEVRICDRDGLGFDLDTPHDLDVYEDSLMCRKS
jgi:2-phospho-L-lactate guanylyltransferase